MRLEDLTKSPPYHKDRLFSDLQKYTCSPRATQLLPDYKEFRLGHGDPLMQAVMKHWIDMLHPRKKVVKQKEEEKDYDKEIHLTQQGSPFCNLGFNDIVHLGKDTILSFPCLPMGNDDEEEEHLQETK
jgi:hypothetical protein